MLFRSQLSDLVNEHPTAAHFLACYVRLLIRMDELEDAERQLARLETLEPGSDRLRECRTALARAKQK